MSARWLSLACGGLLLGCRGDGAAPPAAPAASGEHAPVSSGASPATTEPPARAPSAAPPAGSASASSCDLLCTSRPSFAAPAPSAKKVELPSLTDEQGRRVDLAPGTGWTVVVIVWNGTPPSQEMTRAFAVFARAFEGRDDFRRVIVDADGRDALSVDTLLGGEPLAKDIHVVHDPDSTVARAFGTSMFPETHFVDGSGRLRVRYDGAIPIHSVGFQRLLDQYANGADCDVAIHHGLGADGAPDPGHRIVAEGPGAEACTTALRGR